MNEGSYVFSQLMRLIHRQSFARIVERHSGNYRVRSFTCWLQFLCMSFGQLSQRDSLRDVVTCLNAHSDKLFHMGFSSGVSRSTLAEANEERNYLIYEDLAKLLISKARKLYQGDLEAISFDNAIYALDSTTIELCLNVFWWAKFREEKAAIKLHTLLDVRREIPCFIHISDGKMHDVTVLDVLVFEPEAFYVMDRGYIDWVRMYRIHMAGAFFVVRAKKNLAFERLYSSQVDKQTGLRCDQIIRLKTYKAATDYPEKLRRIKYYDVENDVTYVYLTNNFSVTATEVVSLYINRWKVETFFKWVKQHLRIKRFWGESANAVKTQIWVAVCTFVLVAIAKHQLKSLHSLNEMLQVISVSLFDKTPLNQLLNKSSLQNKIEENPNQLKMFDL